MTLSALQKHAQRYRELRDQLNEKIGAEWSRGATMAEIAEAVGLSRQRVHQIVVELSVAGKLKPRIVTRNKTTLQEVAK